MTGPQSLRYKFSVTWQDEIIESKLADVMALVEESRIQGERVLKAQADVQKAQKAISDQPPPVVHVVAVAHFPHLLLNLGSSPT